MKPTVPINLDCIPEKEYLSPEFQLGVSSKSNGLFIYETSDPSVFTVNQDGIVTITGPGRAYVIIKQLESENFTPNQINRLIIVNKSKPPITFLGPSTVLLKNTPLNVRTLKIQTLTELIKNVFSTDETVLKILQISSNEYELIPVSLGKTSIVVSTRSNYYFNSTSAIFNIEVLETLEDQPLIININTFAQEFKHNALKDIDILTSNNVLEPKSNNLQITTQQQTRGYNYDIPILNLAADKFINDINNYNREILCCNPTDYVEFSVQWDFNNNTVYDYFPYEGNINDRPKINIFRSDGKYIDYVSGGFNFLKIPPNSPPSDPNAYIYQKWGNRNTGIKRFKVPDIKCLLDNTGTFIPFNPNTLANFWDFTQDPNNKTLTNFRVVYQNGLVTADWGDGSQSGISSNVNYSHTFKTTGSTLPNIYYGIDFFTTEDLRPTLLNPPSGQWTITNTGPDEIKYQYLFTGNYEKNIVVQLPPFVAPNVPAGLMASNITVNGMTISWTANPRAVSYRLDVSTASDFATRLAGYDNLVVNGTSQSVTGLTAGTIYYVRARAVNAAGTGPNSATLTQITVPVAPNQPAITNVTSATFTASWNSVAGASEYRVDVATSNNFTSGFVTGYNDQVVNGTSVSVIGLNPNTTYYVRVRAVNTLTANTVTSANSPNAQQITLLVAPNALTATNITTTGFTANWNSVTGAASYRIDVSTASNFATRLTGYDNLTVNGTSQSITGLTAGTTYYVRVRAVNAVGSSNNSPSLIETTDPIVWEIGIEGPTFRPVSILLEGSPNIVVDWGDGTPIQTYTTPGLKYKPDFYYNAGNYILKISGFFNNGSGLLNFDYFPENDVVRKFKYTSVIPYISGLTEIPDLFRGGAIFTSFPSQMEIPKRVFYLNPQLTNFNYVFDGVKSPLLSPSVPSGLFSQNINAKSFKSTFSNCGIDSLPENLFINNTGAIDFSYCFIQNPLTNIPEKLFEKNTEVESFGSTFEFNTAMYGTTVPSGLFANNLKVKGVNFGEGFNSTFSTLSTNDYSNLLKNLALNADLRNPNVRLRTSTAKYNSSAQSARNILTGRGWTIIDNGLEI